MINAARDWFMAVSNPQRRVWFWHGSLMPAIFVPTALRTHLCPFPVANSHSSNCIVLEMKFNLLRITHKALHNLVPPYGQLYQLTNPTLPSASRTNCFNTSSMCLLSSRLIYILHFSSLPSTQGQTTVSVSPGETCKHTILS